MAKAKYDYWYVVVESFDERYPQYTRMSWHHPSKVNPNFTVHNSKTGETKCLFRLKYLCKTDKFEGDIIPDDIYNYLLWVWKENGYPELT